MARATSAWILILAFSVAGRPAPAATLELVSRADPAFVSDSAMGESLPATAHAASADGRYWVFTSTARNLVAGQVDRNGGTDVFLYDRVAGAVTLVSRAFGTPATTGGAASQNPALSVDGRFVAFESLATDLIAGQVPMAQPFSQIFLWDRLTQATVLVSHGAASDKTPGNLYSVTPRVSAAGGYVAYASYASDLVPGQVDSVQSTDIFVYERASRGTALVSRVAGTAATATGNAWQGGLEVSGDGRYVAFSSDAENLVIGQDDTFNTTDLFVFDRVGGGTTLVSHAASSANRAVGGCCGLWSGDGRYLAFGSSASDLVAGQSGETDGNVFLWDRLANASILASHSSAGPAATLFADSGVSAISSDGRFVVFVYHGMFSDVYLFDRTTGEVILASHAVGSPATFGNGFSGLGTVSDDGRFVAFTSQATNLVAGLQEANDGNDVFLYDRTTGTVSLVSRRWGSAGQTGDSDSGSRLEISRDGQWIGYASAASDLTDRIDGNGATDFLLVDRVAGSPRIASLRDPGLPSLSVLAGATPQAVSADGRFVVVASADAHVVPGQQTPPAAAAADFPLENLFLYDRLTGTARLVTHAAGSSTLTLDSGGSWGAAMSADDRFVAFLSGATNLTSPPLSPPPQWETSAQLYLFDRATGAVTLVSRSVEPGRAYMRGSAWSLALSADGRYLAFASDATDLVAGFTYPFEPNNVYLFDRVAGLLSLVTRSTADPSFAVGTGVGEVGLSADGRYLAFDSTAASLVAGQVDSAGTSDVFVVDRLTGTRALVSHVAQSPTTTANSGSLSPRLSADGRVVAFTSYSNNLIPASAGAGATPQLYFYDVGNGSVALASHADGNPDAPLGFAVSAGELSRDGRFAVFSGETAYLADQIYLADRQSSHLTLVSHAASSPSMVSGGQCSGPRISGDGRYVTFASRASNLAAGQTGPPFGGEPNLFLFDRQSGTSTLVSRRAGTTAQPGSGPSDAPLLSADGTTALFASASWDLTGDDFDDGWDVYLYRRDTRPGAFFTVPPCRLLDTRAGAQGPLASAAPAAWGTYAACGIPSTARALSVNVTIVAPTGAGFLTLFPGDGPLPPTSTINFRAGQVRANNAVVPLAVGGDGSLAAFASIAGNGSVHVVLDVNGYFE